ncbi:MAG: ABC transporter permease [Bacteroidia bacterium]
MLYEIIESLQKNLLRSILTSFMVAWGIFILVILLGAGEGLHNGVKEMFQDDATNSIWVWPGRTSTPYKGMQTGRRPQFTIDDIVAMQQEVEGVEHITGRYFISGGVTVNYGKEYGSFSVRCVHPAHQKLENTLVKNGRYLNERDLTEYAKVACVGKRAADALFKNVNPLGKYLNVNGIPFRVIGTFEDKGGPGEEEMIYLPITTAQRAFGGSNNIRQMMFTIGDADLEESQKIERRTRQLLAERHTFDPKDQRAVWVRNNIEEFQRFSSIITMIKLFVSVIGVLTLLAGVIGVMVIMLIVVKERTREIGIRKALGAKPINVVGLIMMESLIITGLAGYFGLFTGIIVLEIMNVSLGSGAPYFNNPGVSLPVVFIALGVIVAAGLLAGAIPAIKAARIRPIEALRDE